MMSVGNNLIDVVNQQPITLPYRRKNPLYWIAKIFKAQAVLVIATIGMLITCFFVPVDTSYLDYFN